MFKLAILAALVAIAASGAVPRLNDNPLSPTGRIVGGTATTIERVPYQISLRILNSPSCGGSIISNTWIVTAAHCTTYSMSWYSVRAGSTHSNSGGTIHGLSRLINHPNYHNNRFGVPVHDISLLQLNSALAIGNTRRPIALYNAGEAAAVGAQAIITGWGTLTQGGSSPTVLQTVTIPIVSKASCSSAYSMWGGIPEGQICAAYPGGGRDACQGDSGGPLAINGRLAGVVSWGNGCAQARFPGAYSEVSFYRNWIRSTSGV